MFQEIIKHGFFLDYKKKIHLSKWVCFFFPQKLLKWISNYLNE